MTKDFREFTLSSGTKIFLGKDENSNDKLVKKYEGETNLILHTVVPGSPFCVLENIESGKKEIKEAAVICASKSQDWRDNKKSVKLHIFTGKDVKKSKSMKTGTWSVKGKPKIIKAKRREIKRWLSSNKSN